MTGLCCNFHLPWRCQKFLILSTVLSFTGFKCNRFKVRQTAQIVRQTSKNQKGVKRYAWHDLKRIGNQN
jgi:hypothetical protein